MDITVIIPVYRVEKHIEKCLRSLFTQTKTDNVEFIIVNDCTTDNSIKIAEGVISEYKDLNIHIINKTQNGGLAAARQTGVDKATGTYLINIDSDDWVNPKMLEELYCKAIEDNADIVTCDFFTTYPSKEIYNSHPTPNTGIELARRILCDSAFGTMCNKLIKTSLYKKHNIKVETPHINMCEDQILSFKLACNAKTVSYVPKAYLHYMQNGTSIIYNIGERECNNVLSAMAEIEQYIISNEHIKEEFKLELIYKKLLFKTILVVQSKGEIQKNNSKLYPETTRYIKRHPSLRIDNKIILLLATKGHIKAANFVRSITLILKKLRNSSYN